MTFKIYPTAKVFGKLMQEVRGMVEPLILDNEDFNGDIGDGCVIGSTVILENNVHIAANVTIIGKGCVLLRTGTTIAPGVVIYTSMPNLKKSPNKYSGNHESLQADIIIGKDVFIGANSVIGCGACIADESRIPPLSHIKPFTKVCMQSSNRGLKK